MFPSFPGRQAADSHVGVEVAQHLPGSPRPPRLSDQISETAVHVVGKYMGALTTDDQFQLYRLTSGGITNQVLDMMGAVTRRLQGGNEESEEGENLRGGGEGRGRGRQ